MALTLPYLAAEAVVASADEGSPEPRVGASPPIRPPMGVLRHVDAARTAMPSQVASPARSEVVVLVGGYASCACPDDGAFDALRKRLATMPGYTVVRFGDDPRFPFDSSGAIEPNAISLRDQVRVLGRDHDAVHIVTHSMGGNVADRAFANGLSREDGVATYISWAAPHSGSDAARAITLTRIATGAGDGAFRESLLWLRMEPDSPAVRDLARARPIPPPPGVVRLDLREATDVLVTARDARDPGVASRILTGAVEGHGGILSDPEAIDLTLRTITTRRVPPDERSVALRRAADAESERAGSTVLGVLCLLVIAACVGAVITRLPPRRVVRGLEAFLPRARPRPCP